MNEWTFASDARKTIQSILADNPQLLFTEVKLEERSGGGQQRRGVILYCKEGDAVLTREINCQSPYVDPLLEDAFHNANQKRVDYCFTRNVNRFVLWKTF